MSQNINPKYKEAQESFGRLLTIMDELREKCPWDQKQTLESLRHLTIEELYELSDAIIDKDLNALKGEIGDIMLHLVFYSKIANELQAFDVNDVLVSICEKLIRRHPHIYGDVTVENEQDVKQNWELIKLQESKDKNEKQSILKGVPKSLPSMVKAFRIKEKVGGIGFEWKDRHGVLDKIKEEFDELEEVLTQDPTNQEAKEDEFGDIMFTLICYGRYIGVNPDDALEKVNRKFIKRFQLMEEIADKQNKSLNEMNLEEMDNLWNQAKVIIKNQNI